MTQRAIVTGLGGFVAGHLADRLLASGYEVLGIERFSSESSGRAAGVVRAIGDVCDSAFVLRTLRDFRPSHVFHLAWAFGDSSPGGASNDRNLAAATGLFDAIRRSGLEPCTLLASSSAVYGSSPIQPIDESCALAPFTPYGASKVAIEEVAERFKRDHGLRILVTRTFNLIGARAPLRLLPGSLAAQVVAAERGGSRTIKVGRLDSSRDYLDVRDAARAYVALVGCEPAEYAVFNVCAGVACSSLALAKEFIAAANVPVELVHDRARLQSGDVDTQCGSAARLCAATGWSPMISFSGSVQSMLQHARGVAEARGPAGSG
jgi:nucleoside-diphosphate-sugar epimerase